MIVGHVSGALPVKLHPRVDGWVPDGPPQLQSDDGVVSWCARSQKQQLPRIHAMLVDMFLLLDSLLRRLHHLPLDQSSE
jgi:hypothetical protein